MSDTALSQSRSPSLQGALVAIVGRLREGARNRATVRQLSALSDRQLRDIGLDRADLHTIATSGKLKRRAA